MSDGSVREHISNVIKEELIGPGTNLTLGKYEEGYDIPFYETPRSRYGAGILFPQKSFYESQNDLSGEDDPNDSEEMDSEDVQVSGESQESGEVTEQKPENDYEVTLANEFLPSAMGFSSLIQVSDKLIAVIEGAYYLENKSADSNDGINRKWLRKPFKIELDIEINELLSDKAQHKIIKTGEEKSGLKLHVFSRPSPLEKASSDQRIITFTLVNIKETTWARPRDQDCYFQCGFSISGKDQKKIFLEYPENFFRENLTQEEEEMALLYRHRKIFAVGHGCSIDWSAKDGDEKSAKVETKILPEYEVHPVLPSELSDLNLNMWHLGSEDKALVLKECNRLADKYGSWIEEKRKETDKEIPDKFKNPALRHIERCAGCLERIIKGVETLSENEEAWTAFQYMNKAMLMQYCHYSLSTSPEKIRKWVNRDTLEGKYEPPDYESVNRGWRPFQLAFILMSLRSIVEEDSPDRDIVDLIWFPTGGGKTEAYLGLAAFTIFYRRITDSENAGTTAIMRYTLRLLTTQQFQRAASLICSMEKLRRDNPDLFGSHPITIGLWVGAGVTPNKEKYAIEDLNELRRRRGKNKFLLASCPWCGAQMGPVDITGNQTVVKGYLKLRSPDRIRHVCEDSDCDFSNKTNHDGLPLQIIDEHIYSQPPTLLIGTVDKFALMPWVPEARRIFGLDNNQSHDPPWLIIQDEMHLICGPLGSMVGLYETLIDALCETKREGKIIRPKIVASTATISNAKDQIEKLFGRKQSVLFPPQGLIAGDSFFAEERADMPGRKYVGIFATGLPSQMTTMVRTLSTLVQAPLTGNFSEDEIDPYWTNMIYFNSIRELGHACTLVRGDIPEYLNVISNIRMSLPKGDPRRRYIRQDKELTSRISSDQVTEILNDLFKTHHKDEYAIDICLATNMIQVGLDVSRLSLMVIAGQPKSTSEYIQASSRVGRSNYPGLVFALLNPGKPRDRSHYEHFKSYHQSFYRYVEPTSVTPFSIPVRDRALHALIITLVRYWGNEQNRKHPDHVIDEELKSRIKTLITERVNEVDEDELDSTLIQIDEIWQRWETLHAPKYGSIFGENNDDELMLPSSHNQFEDSCRRPFATPTSMRNVDSSCEAEVIIEYGSE